VRDFCSDDYTQAKPAVAEAEANLRDAQMRLSYTEIKSPISGRIGRAVVSLGNLIGPDSNVLATVVKDDSRRANWHFMSMHGRSGPIMTSTLAIAHGHFLPANPTLLMHSC
jgi:multidrug efflux pump subunit AcrA (membrane-fusion protein)